MVVSLSNVVAGTLRVEHCPLISVVVKSLLGLLADMCVRDVCMYAGVMHGRGHLVLFYTSANGCLLMQA